MFSSVQKKLFRDQERHHMKKLLLIVYYNFLQRCLTVAVVAMLHWKYICICLLCFDIFKSLLGFHSKWDRSRNYFDRFLAIWVNLEIFFLTKISLGEPSMVQNKFGIVFQQITGNTIGTTGFIILYSITCDSF